MSLEERLENDPEFKAAVEYFNDDRMVERVKRGYREALEYERRAAEQKARIERRRARIRRLTFGFFPR